MEFEKDLMKEKRETLTQMLVALMDQKDARQTELKARLDELEKHKSEETDNYWLIQYQKLLDSKPKVMSLLFLQLLACSTSTSVLRLFVWLFKTRYNFLLQGLLEAESQIETELKDLLFKIGADEYVPIFAVKGVGLKQLTYMNDKQLSEVYIQFSFD